MTSLRTLKSLIEQRLSAAAEEIFVMVERVLTEHDEQQAFGCKHRRTLLDTKRHTAGLDTGLEPADFMQGPVCKEVSPEEERSPNLVQEGPEPSQMKEQHEELHQRPEEAGGSTLTLLVSKPWSYTLSDSMHLAVCKEELSPEQQERNSSLVQEEPEPPHIKEEQMEEHLQRPEEANDSTLTFPAVKSEDDDENRKTEPLASTSTEHMNTQAYVKYLVATQPTCDVQLPSSDCSESDTEDSEEWEETRDDEALNTLKSHKTQHQEGQRLPLNYKLRQDLKASQQTHTVKKHFSCTVCGKEFNIKENAEKHIRTHTGDKPFTCAVCGKGYSQKCNLNRHMRVHTGEKPFCCTVCGKVFAYMGHLEGHMITHTGEHPFSCTICEQRFRRKDHVRKHMSSHTWEQPFICTVCDQRFRRRESMKRHMRTHTGENNL